MGKRNQKIKSKATNRRAIRLQSGNHLHIDINSTRKNLWDVVYECAENKNWDPLDNYLKGHICADDDVFTTQDDAGDTPLHVAINKKCRHSTILNMVKKSTPSLFLKNNAEMTPLDLAQHLYSVEGKVNVLNKHAARHGDTTGIFPILESLRKAMEAANIDGRCLPRMILLY
jgi:ankyrin repeat protein